MRSAERMRGLLRSPRLAWEALILGRYDFTYDKMHFRSHPMSMRKRVNLVKAGLNLLHRRLKPWSMPLHMQFELASYCNLRCPVCPVGAQALKRRGQFMDAGLFQRVIDEVGPYLLTASLWAWGEPLLHPELCEILKAIRRHRIASLLSTNGQLLNQDRIQDALIQEPPTHLIVAIDGLSEETNSLFRVGARLEPALAGVKRLAETKRRLKQRLPILHMRFIVMKHNQHEVPQLLDFARSNQFEMLTVRTLSIVDCQDTDQTHRNMVPDAEEFRPYEYRHGERLQRTDYICQEPFWFPTLFADGTLVACEQDYNAQHSLGRISSETTLRDLWWSDGAAEVRRHIRDNAQSISFCRNCPYRDREDTDCSITAHYLNEAMDYSSL